MKILYDITTLGHIHCTPTVQPTGIYNHTEAMAYALSHLNELDVFFCAAPTQSQKAMRYLNETNLFDSKRFPLVPERLQEPRNSIAQLLTSKTKNGTLHDQTIGYQHRHYTPEGIYNPGKFDIYHVNWRGQDTLPIDAYPAIVLTIYDVIALKHPEWFARPGEPNPLGIYLAKLLSSVRSHHVLSVSTQAVKDDILFLFPHISSEQIHLVPLGVSTRFERCLDHKKIEAVKAKYNIPSARRYILCLNTFEPRKNMQAVIDAFSKLTTDTGDLCLVLAGSKGWLTEDIAILSANRSKKHAPIISTGYIDHDDLPALYSGATVFCYPSLDEGFGLPVLEAMRCGVPVVTSNRAPLLEVVGDCATCVNPEDTEAIANALYDLLTDKEKADKQAKRGQTRALKYSWERSAKVMSETYELAVEMRRSSNTYRTLKPRPGSHNKTLTKVAPLNEIRQFQVAASAPDAYLREMRNAFANKRAFIFDDLGQDHSIPLNAFNKEFTLATGEFYKNYSHINWKPSFYVVSSSDLNEDTSPEFNALTGSIYFVEEAVKHLFRDGPDVVMFRRTDSPFEIDSTKGVGGPTSNIPTAIQLAFHLGFDPIYIVDKVSSTNISDVATQVKDQSLTEWLALSRQTIEKYKRHLYQLTVDPSNETLEKRTVASILESDVLPECPREWHASLDETEVLSKMFKHDHLNNPVMIDVGAHRGHSAKHFANRGWKIYCFEPDEDNRLNHLARRFANHPNVTIDPRAVSDKASDGVPFFASEESSGISGLHAFRTSHEQTGLVNVTTISHIVEEHRINSIDFLKIDVEGFDFSVIKGVPWDQLAPDVIECEYEDDKTTPMGHNWRDVADYLREKGYAVYISEWHPIIRYGIPHDWRRVVPYPGVNVPNESWGNLLAFRKDPGFRAIEAAFASLLTTGHAEPQIETSDDTSTSGQNGISLQEFELKDKTPPIQPRQSSQNNSATSSTQNSPSNRPFYAAFGEWLAKRSPKLFAAGKVLRRMSVGVWRRKFWTAPAIVAIVAIVAISFVPLLANQRELIWLTAITFAIGIALLFLAVRLYVLTQIQTNHFKTLQSQIDIWRRQQGDSAKTQIQQIRAEIVNSTKNVSTRIDKVVQDLSHVRSFQQNFQADLNRIQQSLRDEFADKVTAIENESSSALKSVKNGLEAQIKEVEKSLQVDFQGPTGRLDQKIEALDERVQSTRHRINKAVSSQSVISNDISYLKERMVVGEQQIQDLKYSNSPSTIVFFGHHKCASRFFRNQVFSQVASITGAITRRYEIDNPPFHYSSMEELDLKNMDFANLGGESRDVVLFANATKASLHKIQENTSDWRGIRVIRDPRQVLVSAYLHHIGDHETEGDGWVWDALVRDKKILRELSQEEGLIYELDHISKEVIEKQILEPFDDERIMTIKLEDFASKPEIYLKSISEFLRVAQIAGINLNATNANSNSVPWPELFTMKVRSTFKERYGDQLISLGYAKNLNW